MVVASSKDVGGWGLPQQSRPPLDMETSKLFIQRAAILILMVMVLLPFVFYRLFIFHITFLPTAEYTELQSSPSSSPINSPSKKITAFGDDDDRLIQTSDGDQVERMQMHDEKEKEEEDGHESKHTEKHSAQKITGNPSENQQEKEGEDDHDLKHKEKHSAEKTTEDPLQDQQEKEEEDSHGHKHTKKHSAEKKIAEFIGNREQDHMGDGDPIQLIDFTVGGCNIWKGKWIRHHSPPAYTNATCEFIQGHQNCLKNGRPDRKYLHWRWKPHDCELPLFDAKEFLTLVHGKSWAFVGDSIARNHFQSILCFLAQVETPENLYRDDKDLFVRWFFPSYNFTLAVFWSPFLVKWTGDDIEGLPSGIEKLYLDVVDKNWVSSIQDYDYVVLSAAHWFMKSSIYFTNNEVIGCHYVQGSNLTQLGFYYGLRTALRTVYNLLASSSYRGVVFFRTFTPDHFENGQWHEGGNCMRTTPTHNATLDGVTLEMYKIQLEEFGRALQLRNTKASFKIVDTIHASIVRADGHPGPYRSVGSSRNDLPQDCLHWCLPGAIDTWSAMLLDMLRHA